MTASLSPTAITLDGGLYRYAFIGNGAQFRVYKVDTLAGKPTGRVIKVPLHYDETKQIIFEPLKLLGKHRSDDELAELADRRTREVMQLKYDIPNLIQGIRGQDQRFMRQLGQLKILQTPIPAKQQKTESTYLLPTLYTQDYVMTLDEYLQNFRLAAIPYTRTLQAETMRQLKYVVDQMITLHFAIWEYGIFEFVFKPENFGIRRNGSNRLELIWMDLAEHITDLSEAEAIMAEERWRHPLLPHKIDYQFMPQVLHDYYTQACRKNLTVENLRKRWRKSCTKQELRRAKQLKLKELLTHDDKKIVAHWIARHNLSISLYHGFPDQVIDDMQIPTADIKLLVNHRPKMNTAQTGFKEEKTERAMAQQGVRHSTISPLIIPADFLQHRIEKRL